MKKSIVVSKGELQEFGKRVRSIREHMRLKQNEFAAGLDLSEGYICQIEKGKANPTYEFFYKLASKYNASMDYLFYGKGELFFKRKLAVEESEGMRDSIDSTDDLLWFMEHSELFRMKIMVEAKRYLYESEENIRRDIQHERKKRKKEEKQE
ncbi:MAG: helix-turn-helix domain-containing protein [Candidatus Aminicenantes bacterium]|jgi:transcriptional regulator with XRE-family HTH domain